MNSDTERSTKRILENGYYRQSQSLGEGGWGFLYSKGVDNWKTYVLFGDEPHPIEEITAKDDKTAIKAFSGLYYLDMLGDYEIIEKIVTTCLVKKAGK